MGSFQVKEETSAIFFIFIVFLMDNIGTLQM